jgi:hypothetical protein
VYALDTGAGQEAATVLAVGTAGATGTGVTLAAPLAQAHPSGAQLFSENSFGIDSDGNLDVVNPLGIGTATVSTTLATAANAGARTSRSLA